MGQKVLCHGFFLEFWASIGALFRFADNLNERSVRVFKKKIHEIFCGSLCFRIPVHKSEGIILSTGGMWWMWPEGGWTSINGFSSKKTISVQVRVSSTFVTTTGHFLWKTLVKLRVLFCLHWSCSQMLFSRFSMSFSLKGHFLIGF